MRSSLVAAIVLGLSLGRTARAADKTEVAVKLTPAEIGVGQTAKIAIEFKVPASSHISPDAPLSIRVKAPKSVRVERPVLHYKDAIAPAGASPRFEDRAVGDRPGVQEIELALSYYVCTADLCNRETSTRHLQLSVK